MIVTIHPFPFQVVSNISIIESYPRPVTLLSEGVEGRTLCVGGTETEREGEEVE